MSFPASTCTRWWAPRLPLLALYLILLAPPLFVWKPASASSAPGFSPRWGMAFGHAASSPTSHQDGSSSSSSSCLEADELMRQRGAENYLQAYQEYKKMLEANAGDKELKFKVAEAAISLMRTKSNANAVLIDGISDSEENIKLWKKYGPEAYAIMKDLHKEAPDDPKVNFLMTEAFTYTTSSKGIVKAAVTGDGFTFMKYIANLIKRFPEYDAGIAYIYQGAFSLAAPWPLKDLKKGLWAFEKAVEAEPKSLRNNYYLGVGAYHNGDYSKAAKYFEAATQSQPVSHSEHDVQDFFRRESHRGLQAARDKLNMV